MRVNKAIRAEKVRVIDIEGKQIGVMKTEEALALAREKGVDLVEVAPQARPPVCKIIDYGKFKYQQTKKEKKQHQVRTKEVKLTPNIDEHDLEVKIERAKKFLQKGNKVKFTCTFRGREMLHMEIGEKLVEKIYQKLQELSQVELPMKRIGRTITTTIAPLGKKAKKIKET